MMGQTLMVIMDWDLEFGRSMRLPYYVGAILMSWFFFAGAVELEKRANEFGFEKDNEMITSFMEAEETEEEAKIPQV